MGVFNSLVKVGDDKFPCEKCQDLQLVPPALGPGLLAPHPLQELVLQAAEAERAREKVQEPQLLAVRAERGEPAVEACGASIRTIRRASRLAQFLSLSCPCSSLPACLCCTSGENTTELRDAPLQLFPPQHLIHLPQSSSLPQNVSFYFLFSYVNIHVCYVVKLKCNCIYLYSSPCWEMKRLFLTI